MADDDHDLEQMLRALEQQKEEAEREAQRRNNEIARLRQALVAKRQGLPAEGEAGPSTTRRRTVDQPAGGTAASVSIVGTSMGAAAGLLQLGRDAPTAPGTPDSSVNGYSKLKQELEEDKEAGIMSPASQPERVRPQPHKLTRADLDALRTAARTGHKYLGQEEKSLAQLVNVDLADLAEAVMVPGSVIIHGPEQADKTLVMAGLAIVNVVSGVRAPCIMMVKDLAINVKGVVVKMSGCEADEGTSADSSMRRMNGILNDHEITAMYGLKKFWDGLEKNRHLLHSFKTGLLVPVLVAACHQLRHMHQFLEKYNIGNVVLIIDECDAFHCKGVRDPAPRTREELARRDLLKREVPFYQTVGVSPLSNNGYVRSLIQISATHLVTLAWHDTWNLPFRGLSMDLPGLESTYTLYKDLMPMRVAGQDQFLDPTLMTNANRFGLGSEEFKEMLRQFDVDARIGKMILVAVTKYVNANPEKYTNLRSVALAVFERCPTNRPLLIVAIGRGSVVIDSPDAIPMQFTSQDVVRTPQNKIMPLGLVIQQQHEKIGAGRPIVVIGMSAVGRSVSIRSVVREGGRVLTHIIAALPRDRTIGDLSQVLMRGAGRTREIRESYGFTDGILVLTVKEDLEAVKELYEFTRNAIVTAGNRQQGGLARWIERLRRDLNSCNSKVLTGQRPLVPRAAVAQSLIEELNRIKLGEDSRLERRPERILRLEDLDSSEDSSEDQDFSEDSSEDQDSSEDWSEDSEDDLK